MRGLHRTCHYPQLTWWLKWENPTQRNCPSNEKCCRRMLQYLPRRPWTNVVHHPQQHRLCRDAHWLSKSYQDNHISSCIWFLLILSSTIFPVICKIFCGKKLFLTMLKTFSNKIDNGTNMGNRCNRWFNTITKVWTFRS